MWLLLPVNKMLVTEFSILIFEGAANSYRVFLTYRETWKGKQRLGGSPSFFYICIGIRIECLDLIKNIQAVKGSKHIFWK